MNGRVRRVNAHATHSPYFTSPWSSYRLYHEATLRTVAYVDGCCHPPLADSASRVPPVPGRHAPGSMGKINVVRSPARQQNYTTFNAMLSNRRIAKLRAARRICREKAGRTPARASRTLLRPCFARLLTSFVGEPDRFATGASRDSPSARGIPVIGPYRRDGMRLQCGRNRDRFAAQKRQRETQYPLLMIHARRNGLKKRYSFS